MRFARDIYFSDGIASQKKDIMKCLKRQKLKKHVFVIYFNQASNTPEFIYSIFLKQKYYKQYPMYVIGVVETYEQAVKYVAGLLKDSFLMKGNFNVKENVCRC